MATDTYNGLDPHQRAFIKLVKENAHRHRCYEVFRDFCELAALSFSNAVDRQQFEAREARYLEIVKGYSEDEVNRFPAMLAELTASLTGHFHDALGEIFMALDLGSHWHGQYFTPYSVASLMARMTMHDAGERIEREGFITLCEPAAGAGAMVIAAAEAVTASGHNHQRHMHVTTVDVDPTAVHMAYIQLSLLHIPAIVVHGNSLTLKQWGYWVTPAHVMGFWDQRLRRRDEAAQRPTSSAAPDPAPAGSESVADAVAVVRAAVLEHRGQLAEQLALFG